MSYWRHSEYEAAPLLRALKLPQNICLEAERLPKKCLTSHNLRSLEYDDSMNMHNIWRHVERNTASCKDAFADYKKDKTTSLLLHKESGVALSSRNIHHYFYLTPHLYFPSMSIPGWLPNVLKQLTGRSSFHLDIDDCYSFESATTVQELKNRLIKKVSWNPRIEVEADSLSASRGLLCFDPNAGIAGPCDHLLITSSFGRRKVCCIEYAVVEPTPEPGYLWCEVGGSLMPRLVHSIVGHNAQVGLAITQIGLKVLLPHRDSRGRVTKFTLWPDTEDFTDDDCGDLILDAVLCFLQRDR